MKRAATLLSVTLALALIVAATTQSVLAAQGDAKAAASKPAATSQPTTAAAMVYVTDSGKKYHAEGCRHLTASKTAMTLSDAKDKGYTPCSVCNAAPTTATAPAASGK
jgi:hypothetical protein